MTARRARRAPSPDSAGPSGSSRGLRERQRQDRSAPGGVYGRNGGGI